MTKTITVKLNRQPYQIHIGTKGLRNLAGLIEQTKTGTDAVVITTPRIQSLHGKNLKKALDQICTSVLTLSVPDSEQSKQAKVAFRLIDQITKFDQKKKLFLAAFGGGVVGDLTGFIAAIYKRGVPYVQIPTTLLAQIDSSIGGKTAVDTGTGKNLIGAFYQPRFVLSDTDLLKSLPKSEMLSGLSEAVKYAVIKDPGLFSFLQNNYRKILRYEPAALEYLISRCAEIKAKIVAADEFDRKGVRIILNFGHTFGHAIEAASGYKISHGNAVSVGMACACQLSRSLGLLKEKDAARILGLIKTIGLSMGIKGIPLRKILNVMTYDKKFTRGTNRFVLIEKIGVTKIVDDIPQDLIRTAIAEQLI